MPEPRRRTPSQPAFQGRAFETLSATMRVRPPGDGYRVSEHVSTGVRQAREMTVALAPRTNVDSMSYQVNKSDAEWREQLSPEEFQVLRKAGTEAPFKGEYT